MNDSHNLSHSFPRVLVQLACGEFLMVTSVPILYLVTHLNWMRVLPISLLYGVFSILILMGFGLYHRSICIKKSEHLPRLLLALLMISLIINECAYCLPWLDIGQGQWAITYGISLASLLLCRIFFMKNVDSTIFKRRVLVLGAGRKALQFFKQIGSGTQGTVIVGYVHQPGERELLDKKQVLYSISSLCEYAEKNHIEEIVVAVDDRRNGFPLQQLLNCRLCGIEVTDVLYFYERECGQIKLDILDPSWLIFSKGFKNNLFYFYTKEVLDYIFSFIVFIISSPILFVTFCLLRLHHRSKANIIVSRTVVGLGGAPTVLHDLNVLGQEGWLVYVIDKLHAQDIFGLWNVLRGKMSLIGPEPHDYETALKLTREIPYYNERHMVRPGLLGWTQSIIKNKQLVLSKQQSLEYDLYYVKNASLFMDFVLMIGELSRWFTKRPKVQAVEVIRSSS